MRKEPTDAEARLWRLLRNRRFANFKFRRQLPIGPFIADFVCPAAKLVIELDGSQHLDSADDLARDAYLRAQGFSILRLWNTTVLLEPNSTLDTIWAALHGEICP